MWKVNANWLLISNLGEHHMEEWLCWWVPSYVENDGVVWVFVGCVWVATHLKMSVALWTDRSVHEAVDKPISVEEMRMTLKVKDWDHAYGSRSTCLGIVHGMEGHKRFNAFLHRRYICSRTCHTISKVMEGSVGCWTCLRSHLEGMRSNSNYWWELFLVHCSST